jgi:hypothetical protein
VRTKSWASWRAYCSELCVHAGFAQGAPGDEGHDGGRQTQTSRCDGGIRLLVDEPHNVVVGPVALGAVLEVGGDDAHASGYNPVSENPVVGGEGYRDDGQQEEDDGRHEGQPQRFLVLHTAGCAQRSRTAAVQKVVIDKVLTCSAANRNRVRRDKGMTYLNKVGLDPTVRFLLACLPCYPRPIAEKA